MNEFNYEKSTWGAGDASLKISDPTAFRLKMSLDFLDVLEKKGKVLEVGCGEGQFVRAIKKYDSSLDCYGSDVSQNAIDKAKNYNDGVKYFISEENILPFEDSLFDAVLIYDVLEHVKNPEIILKEISRVLKKDGLFYVFVPCEGDYTSFWFWLKKIGLGNKLTFKYAGHINYFSRKSLFSLVKNNNFEILQVRYSEHILGQLLGIVSFYLMDKKSKREKNKQLNNEKYFNSFKRSPFGLFAIFKKIINSLVYIESLILRVLPSSNVHIQAKNNK